MALIYLTSVLAPLSLWYCGFIKQPQFPAGEAPWKDGRGELGAAESPSTLVLSQAWLPGYQRLLALVGGSPLLQFMSVLMNSLVILVAFYYLDPVKRACGLKWKEFTFKFGVMSDLAEGNCEWGSRCWKGNFGWKMIHPNRSTRENFVTH